MSINQVHVPDTHYFEIRVQDYGLSFVHRWCVNAFFLPSLVNHPFKSNLRFIQWGAGEILIPISNFRIQNVLFACVSQVS
jgi:hypothetical protein